MHGLLCFVFMLSKERIDVKDYGDYVTKALIKYYLPFRTIYIYIYREYSRGLLQYLIISFSFRHLSSKNIGKMNIHIAIIFNLKENTRIH